MTMLVHLIDERERGAVKRSGIRGEAATVRSGDQDVEFARAVFAMPVLPNYFVTHQWLRELKRRGMRTVAGGHFKQRSDAMVWVGRYNGDHRNVPLGHAVSLIIAEPDPRGWQVVIPKSIPANAIHAIRAVPQVVGWRYFPESHERGPWKCLCDFCVPSIRGDIKSMALRRRLLASHGAETLNIDGDVERVVRSKRWRARGDRDRR